MFFFPSFGLGFCILFFGIMIYYVFFQGRKKRYKSTSSNPARIGLEKNSPYPSGTTLHRATGYVLPELRKQMRELIEKEDFLKSGDWVIDSPRGKVVYVNSVIKFTGTAGFLYYATNYEGLKDGSIYPEILDPTFYAENILSIRIFPTHEGKGLKISLTKEDPEDPEELYFEFRGDDAESMAENMKKRLYAKMDEAREMRRERERRKSV